MKTKSNMEEKPKPSSPLCVKTPGALYAWPMGLWFVVFFLAPIAIILVFSFLARNIYGFVLPKFSFVAYIQMFNAKYAVIFFRTLWIAVVSTVITILIALPCGYAMARSKWQTLFLFLIIIPFWTNSLIRIFAWKTILSSEGFLCQTLRHLHIIASSAKLLYTKQAVILVSIYMYIPYAILPIFTAVDRFDFSLLEAARDLGATKAQGMMKVLIPEIKSGIITAVIFTFIPIFGAYAVPLYVGDIDCYMLGNIIADQIKRARNYPLASSFSCLLTLLSTLGVLFVSFGNKKTSTQKVQEDYMAASIAGGKTK